MPFVVCLSVLSKKWSRIPLNEVKHSKERILKMDSHGKLAKWIAVLLSIPLISFSANIESNVKYENMTAVSDFGPPSGVSPSTASQRPSDWFGQVVTSVLCWVISSKCGPKSDKLKRSYVLDNRILRASLRLENSATITKTLCPTICLGYPALRSKVLWR